MQTTFADAIQAVRDELSVEIAVCPEQVHEALRLRHGVSCEERIGLEQDEFDPSSCHVLVRSRQTGVAVAAVRVVMSDTGLDGLPIRRVCAASVLRPLPAMSTGEISRFVLVRDRSGVSAAAGALVRLALIRGIVQISAEQKLTHWCAVMERPLLRSSPRRFRRGSPAEWS